MRLKKASEATKDLQRSSGRPDTDKAAQNGGSLHNSKHRTSSPLASLHRSTAPASSPSLPQPQPHSHQAIPNPNRPSQPQSASPYSSTFPPHLQARTQDIQSRFEARARTNSAPHPLASSAASTSSPAPHVRSSSVQGRQVPNVNLNGSTPPTQVQRIRYEALYQIQKEASIYACGRLFDRVRIEIIQLAETGGIRELPLRSTFLRPPIDSFAIATLQESKLNWKERRFPLSRRQNSRRAEADSRIWQPTCKDFSCPVSLQWTTSQRFKGGTPTRANLEKLPFRFVVRLSPPS